MNQVEYLISLTVYGRPARAIIAISNSTMNLVVDKFKNRESSKHVSDAIFMKKMIA